MYLKYFKKKYNTFRIHCICIVRILYAKYSTTTLGSKGTIPFTRTLQETPILYSPYNLLSPPTHTIHCSLITDTLLIFLITSKPINEKATHTEECRRLNYVSRNILCTEIYYLRFFQIVNKHIFYV